jgi:hypothetical protein
MSTMVFFGNFNIPYTPHDTLVRSEFCESVFWQNYFYHCDKIREERQREINEGNRWKAQHDEELDAELVGRPPASCTGFYPKTGKLQDYSSDVKMNHMEEESMAKIDTCDSEDFVMVEKYVDAM